MPCPQCATALSVVEFETEPAIQIERCSTCHGLFFNPGEIETLLEKPSQPLGWLEPTALANEEAHSREVAYQKCPVCAERMSRFNFGKNSSVIADRCGSHGIWLEGDKLRKLADWWHAGGKSIYQNPKDRAKAFCKAGERRGSITSPKAFEIGPLDAVDSVIDSYVVLDLIVSAVSWVVEE